MVDLAVYVYSEVLRHRLELLLQQFLIATTMEARLQQLRPMDPQALLAESRSAGGTNTQEALKVRGNSNTAKGIEVYNAGGALNASIKVDGSATFAGIVEAGSMEIHPYSDAGGLQIFKNGSSSIVNVELKQDGAATFAGDVKTGFFNLGDSFIGGGLSATGTLDLRRDYGSSASSTVNIIKVKAAGDDTSATYTDRFTVMADGSATFASYIVAEDNGIFAQSTDATHGLFAGKLGSTGNIEDDWNVAI